MSTGSNASQESTYEIGPDWFLGRRDEFLSQVKVVDLPRLQTPYPPPEPLVEVSPNGKVKQIKDRYNQWFRREILHLDYPRLQYIIPQNVSVIIRDSETKEIVLIILRDFVPGEDMKHTITSVCQMIASHYQYNTDDSAGIIRNFGYGRDARDEKQKNANSASKSLALIVWNLMESKFPDEIIGKYNDIVREHGFPRMDMVNLNETFSFNIGGEDVVSDASTMDPEPSIGDGNDWMISFNINAPEDPYRGGKFYLASYGVAMLPAANTAAAYRPWASYSASPSKTPGKRNRKIRANNKTRIMTSSSLGLASGTSNNVQAGRARSNTQHDDNRGRVKRTRRTKAEMMRARALSTNVPSPYNLRPRTTKPTYNLNELPRTDDLSENEREPYNLRPRSTKPAYNLNEPSPGLVDDSDNDHADETTASNFVDPYNQSTQEHQDIDNSELSGQGWPSEGSEDTREYLPPSRHLRPDWKISPERRSAEDIEMHDSTDVEEYGAPGGYQQPQEYLTPLQYLSDQPYVSPYQQHMPPPYDYQPTQGYQTVDGFDQPIPIQYAEGYGQVPAYLPAPPPGEWSVVRGYETVQDGERYLHLMGDPSEHHYLWKE
ncbi:hypothetical protein F5Y11DRAFT_367500 [Daldinia sp. FL1419]|nr:hypothetical protein F5Y11DRAFT_367500 [Daldinia sp. FL1419]